MAEALTAWGQVKRPVVARCLRKKKTGPHLSSSTHIYLPVRSPLSVPGAPVVNEAGREERKKTGLKGVIGVCVWRSLLGGSVRMQRLIKPVLAVC